MIDSVISYMLLLT